MGLRTRWIDRGVWGSACALLALVVGLATACSTSAGGRTGRTIEDNDQSDDDDNDQDDTDEGSSGAASGSNGSGSSGDDNEGSSGSGGFVLEDVGVTPPEGEVIDGRCDDAGNCICVNVATFGVAGKTGGQSGTKMFENWLNSNSNAHADTYSDDTPITRELLKKYDVILFQNLKTWDISDEEVAVIEAWVKGGGGLLTLSGYESSATEIDSANKILAPFGLAYNADYAVPSSTGRSVPIRTWSADSPISRNVTAVGVMYGRSVKDVGGNGTLVARYQNATTKKEWMLGYTVAAGKGKVFAWNDEWITYSVEWTGQGYQVPQFWYNTLQFLTPESACKLEVKDVILL